MPRDFCSLRCLKPLNLDIHGAVGTLRGEPPETGFRLADGSPRFAAAMIYDVAEGCLGKSDAGSHEHVSVDGSMVALVVQWDQWPPGAAGLVGTGTLYIEVAGSDPDDSKLNALERYFKSHTDSDASPDSTSLFKDPCAPKVLGRFSIERKAQKAEIAIGMQEGDGELLVGSHILHPGHGHKTMRVKVDGRVVAGGLVGAEGSIIEGEPFSPCI